MSWVLVPWPVELQELGLDPEDAAASILQELGLEPDIREGSELQELELEPDIRDGDNSSLLASNLNIVL